MSQVSAESEFQYQSAILTLPEKGIEVDISQTIMELILYESVNVPYITGTMICADTEYAFESFKMDGTERLELNLVAQEYNYSLTKKFIITRTIGKTKMDEGSFAYNFYITEETFFLDVLKKVSRAYTGKPNEIIQNVLSSEFNKNLDLRGKESNQSAFTYVSPYISPLAIIETIRRRASDRNGYPFFVYATIKEDSIRMKSLSDMIETDPINTIPFTYSAAQNYNPDRVKQLTNIEYYQELGNNDTAEMLMKGAVQNQYNVLNLSTNKRNRNNKFNITQVLDAKEHSIYNKDLKIQDKTLDEYDPNVVYRIVNHTTIDELGYHDEQDIEMHMNKMKANSLVAALEKKKMNIILPGILNFHEDTVFVGEQIMVNLPHGGRNEIDQVASGPYVVLEVKHKFSENKYSQAMTCSKLTNAMDRTVAVGPSGYQNS